ncbi:cysteine proteinase [Tothia fuscella]|uniref:ubiquitinyl hydrolase 1 n=1 Tax=Tothia fuscella TaxID=1048955 RepID=A0A9P4NN42_9PEZI|nr:cysteine proteinase [Tothia fuscella]
MEPTGQTAPRLIAVLKQTDRRYRSPSERNPFIHKPRGYDERFDSTRTEQSPLRSCKHYWTTQTVQTVLPEADNDTPYASPPLEGGKYRVACFCQHCRWHVDISLEHRGNSCPKENFPLHHFVDFKQSNPDCEYYSARCSGCEAMLHVEYREFRIQPHAVALLTDTGLLNERYQDARRADPERVNFQPTRPLDVLDALSCYVRDSLKAVETHRSIPRLNRRFLLSFGTDCDDFLRSIGFVQTDSHWELPRPPDPNPWSWDLRQVLEDVQEELWAVMRLNMPLGTDVRKLKGYNEKPGPSDADLQRLLGTTQYDKSKTTRRSPMLSQDEEIWYTALGALGDFSDELLRFAFDRQAACDPAGTPFYFDCFKKLANKRNSEELQTGAAILESEGYFTIEDVSTAYRYFTIDPQQANLISDEHIRGMFETRLSSSAVWQEHEIRDKLRIIALARNSNDLQDVATNNIQTAESALKWLESGYDGSLNISDERVINLAAVKKGENPNDEQLQEQVKSAVQLIADERNSEYLKIWLASGEAPPLSGDDALAAAYRYFNIDDRTIVLEKEVLVQYFNVAISEHPEKIEEIQKHYNLLMQHSQQETPKQEADFAEPVGLRNLGNTCYLNSLLQYFYAVKPFRELVENYEALKQELGPDESTEYGFLQPQDRFKNPVTKREVEKAQAFVPTLARLFETMSTQPSPAQPTWDLASRALEDDENASNTFPQAPEDTVSKKAASPDSHAPNSPNELPPTPDSTTASGEAASDNTLIGDGEVVMTPPSEADENQKGENGSAQTVENRKDSMEMDTGKAQPELPSRQPPPIPPRPQTTSDESATKRETESAAAQQDAREVAAKILKKMQRAFAPDRFDDGDLRHTVIKDLFYHNLKRRHASGESVIESSEVIISNLALRPASIQACLDNWFGYDALSNQFSTATYLPALLQISINRRYWTKSPPVAMFVKHNIPLDDTIHMDRYLESDSPKLAELREQTIDYTKELFQLEKRQERLSITECELVGPDALDLTYQFISRAGDELGDTGNLLELLKDEADTRRAELQDVEKRIADLEKRRSEIPFAQFDTPSNAYKIFAVIFHRGPASSASGHYWAYIRDFKADKWRKYNDEYVTDVAAPREIFEETDPATTGAPSMVIYVRNDLKETVIDPVHRVAPPQAGVDTTAAENGDVDMTDDVDGLPDSQEGMEDGDLPPQAARAATASAEDDPSNFYHG